MKKIGLSIAYLDKIEDRIFINGISQNIMFLYNYLKNIENVQVYFISNGINFKYNSILCENLNEIKTFDIVICIGLKLNYKFLHICKENKVKLIYWRMGNDLLYTTNEILNYKNGANLELDYLYDETWISPHFEYGIDYYKYIHNSENVLVAPYFWQPDFIYEQVNNNFDEINIGVFESNTFLNKSCFIPIIICEKAKEHINKAYILGSKNLYDTNKKFKEFANNSTLFKKNKMTFENRHRFCYIMKNYCNVVVSFVENCDLNYLFLECFYLGIPLIHNSKMLKDYGYYYEGCNVSQAAEHIKNIKLNGFNKEEYIAKHKAILYKYSLENPETQYFLNKKLELV